MDSILIIDDEPQIRKLLSRMMELEGYEVFQAADCQSTLKQLKLHNPQVVLCDVFLPDGNGVDMVTTIKKLYCGSSSMIKILSIESFCFAWQTYYKILDFYVSLQHNKTSVKK